MTKLDARGRVSNEGTWSIDQVPEKFDRCLEWKVADKALRARDRTKVTVDATLESGSGASGARST